MSTLGMALSERELSEVVSIRHDLHMHPEIAYQEVRTAGVIARELRGLGLRTIDGLAGGTGVVAHLPATGEAGVSGARGGARGGEIGGAHGGGLASVGLRADIDALPIVEQTGLSYASAVPGKMHACGHDGHTAIMLGVARVLARVRRPRAVTLVFQPAEEGGGGGERLCDEGLIEGRITGTPIAEMYGLHGWPDIALGSVGTRPGPLLASTDELRVTIRGVQSHAAYPHQGRDAVLAMAHCITAVQSVASRSVAPTDSVVVSVCIVQAGTAVNVLPQTASFAATLRCLKGSTRELAKRRLSEIVSGTAMAFGCTAELHWEDGYPVTHNDPALTAAWFELADGALGRERVVRIEHPTMGGEDFSYYARLCPSVFFCLGLNPGGAERTASLHQPEFDFNDAAIPLGVEMFCRLATRE